MTSKCPRSLEISLQDKILQRAALRARQLAVEVVQDCIRDLATRRSQCAAVWWNGCGGSLDYRSLQDFLPVQSRTAQIFEKNIDILVKVFKVCQQDRAGKRSSSSSTDVPVSQGSGGLIGGIFSGQSSEAVSAFLSASVFFPKT